MKKALVIGFLSLLATTVYAYIQITSYGNEPIVLEEEVLLSIPKGASLNEIIAYLATKNLVHSPLKFKLFAMMSGYAQRVQAGDFWIESSTTPLLLLKYLSSAQNLQIKIAVPEGYNIYEINKLLTSQGITKGTEFLRSAFDPSLLEELSIKNVSVEGYLYPETYFLSRNLPPREIIQKMHGQLNLRYSPTMQVRAMELGFTFNQVLTLASIIEKETGEGSERALISSVFHNRLKQKMRLQTDPTVIYGQIERHDGNISKEDLKRDTPYNTYTNFGLPPGPIANPGIDSIQAALYPATSNYLYFVSKNNGTHQFSDNIRDHNNAVNLYQKGH